jgi:hypothetical protein
VQPADKTLGDGQQAWKGKDVLDEVARRPVKAAAREAGRGVAGGESSGRGSAGGDGGRQGSSPGSRDAASSAPVITQGRN